MNEQDGILYIVDVPNPRVADKDMLNDVEFVAKFNQSSHQPVEFRTKLPLGADYIANLTWEEWKAVVAWMEWRNTSNIAGAPQPN